MSFMNRFKKPEPPDEEKVEFPSKEEQPEEGVDLSPQSEKAKRINKLLVYVVGIFMIVGVGITFRSCGHSKPKEPIETKQTASDVFSEGDLQKAEERARNQKRNTKNNGVKSGKQASSNGSTGSSDSLPDSNDYYVDENGNTRAVPKERTRPSTYRRPSSSYSSGSGSPSVSAPSAPSQPAPLTPYEKYQSDSQAAYYKRQLADEQRSYTEERKANQSDIFFDMKEDRQSRNSSRNRRNNSYESPANQYYNDGVTEDSDGQNNFQDDYIQVVNNGSSNNYGYGSRRW